MTEPARRRLGTLALCLGLAALHLILLLTAIHWVGTDAQLYYSEQMKAGILPEAGITEADLRTVDAQLADLRTVDAQLADYLSGRDPRTDRIDDPQAWLPEARRNAFNERELTHLQDCLHLFDLLRRARFRLVPWAVALILGGAWLLQDRKRARLCAWLSPLIVLVPLGIFALYAALNFDQAFTLFHKLLFRNDLWLLDPRTDLLIRICPESLFRNMGIKIAATSLIAMLGLTVLAVLLTTLWPKRKEENAWKTTTRRGPAPRQYDFGSRGRR